MKNKPNENLDSLPSPFSLHDYGDYSSPWQIFSDADKIPTEIVKWLVEHWIPNQALTLIVGPPNVGKNIFVNTIAAAISQGRKFPLWPGATPNGRGVSIISSTEEDFARVSKAKFIAAGGNESYFKKFNGIPAHHPSIPYHIRPCNFSDSDNEIWTNEARKIQNLGLLIFDPASQVIRGSTSNAKDREGHEKMGQFGIDLDCAVLATAHTPKTTKGKEIYARIAGTGAVGQVARSIIMISKIKGGPTPDGATHLMVLAKPYGEPVNYGVTFSIVGCEITDENERLIKTAKIVWHASIPGEPEDLLNWADGIGEMETVGRIAPVSVAVVFLRQTQQTGPLPCKVVEKLVKDAGISTRNRDAAKRELGVVSFKGTGEGQFSGFYWRLPEPTDKGC